MRKTKLIFIILAGMLLAGFQANGQIGKLKNLKNKVTSKTNKEKEVEKKSTTTTATTSSNSNTETNTGSSNNENKTANTATKMEAGKGYFYTSFKSKEYKDEVNVGDELFVRMDLGKTMIELAAEKGLASSFSAYGFITVSIDGNQSFMMGPISFASNISKVWTFIDIPLNISPDFAQKLAADQSMLQTPQDIWVFQQLYQENSIPKKYATSAITTMSTGNHTVKVEFGLGESSDTEPKATVCTGEVKVIFDAAGSKELAKKGPKNLRPLEEAEKGKFVYNVPSFTVGNSELVATLDLPHPPKYYNMKWCKATSCDYDHGNVELYVSVDNEPVAAWSAQLWNDDYEVSKSFSMVLLPKTDVGYGTVDAPFNNSKLFKLENPVVYALLDLIYSGNLKVGKHQLKFKAFSIETVPLNSTYLFQDSYFSQWPAIAETTIDFIITEEGRAKIINGSTAKKLSHATGEWVAVDKYLLSSNSGTTDFKVIDVATQTQWKVTKNSLGAILYRSCKADVIYKSKDGYRLQKNILVKEDYSGKYGNPYFAERIEFAFGPSLLNSMHLPVPEAKIK